MRTLLLTTLIAAIILPVSLLRADDTKSDPKSKADPKAGKKADEGVEDVKGYLPPYYRYVIGISQRDDIYKIREKYADKIKELKSQLSDLQNKEEEEARALLSPQQKEKLAKLLEEAKASKMAKKPADSDSGEPGLPKPIAKLPPGKFGTKTTDAEKKDADKKDPVKKDAPK